MKILGIMLYSILKYRQTYKQYDIYTQYWDTFPLSSLRNKYSRPPLHLVSLNTSYAASSFQPLLRISSRLFYSSKFPEPHLMVVLQLFGDCKYVFASSTCGIGQNRALFCRSCLSLVFHKLLFQSSKPDAKKRCGMCGTE